MVKEDSAIEKMEKFANQTNRKIHYSIKDYPSNSIAQVKHHQRKIYIPNNSDNTSFLVCFHDPKKIGELEIFCGVFFPVSNTETIVIRQKNFLDKINFLTLSKYPKTGYSIFDSKTVISECSDPSRLKLFQNRKIQEKILEAFSIDLRMKTGLNAMPIDFVTELKDNTHFGIYLTGQWLWDHSKIEDLLSIAETIRNQIIMMTN